MRGHKRHVEAIYDEARLPIDIAETTGSQDTVASEILARLALAEWMTAHELSAVTAIKEDTIRKTIGRHGDLFETDGRKPARYRARVAPR
jgi:hypothetical protein